MGRQNVFSLLPSSPCLKGNSNPAVKFWHVMSFYALQLSFERICYVFARKSDKVFWTRLKEKTFAFVAKWLEHLESRKLLCVHFPKLFTVSAGPGYKVLREGIRCLYINVIDRLCVATRESINDRREQILRLSSSELALIRIPIVH